MTAYIKMIDVWMIFTMMYPFCVVALYSLLDIIKNKKTKSKTGSLDCIDTRDLMNMRTIRTVTFLLDFGLPIFVIIFLIIFWIFGLTNSSELDKLC